MNPMLARIVAAMGAGALGQAISILVQVGSLPIYLLHWDANRYGAWLMLSAIPAYLSMADVGMVTTAGNRMTMDMARGQTEQANRIFHSATLFMITVCGCVVLAATLVLFSGWLSLPFEQASALWFLMVTVLVALFNGLSEAAFKASGRYALGTSLGNLMRLADWLGGLAGLLLDGSYTAVAVGAFVARLTGLSVVMTLATRGNHGLSWGVSHASRQDVLDMVRPAVSFMVFPLSNALTFQGATLLVGHLFGPVSVTVFNAHRTLSRVAVQVNTVLSNALWVEFARLYGLGQRATLTDLYERALKTGSVVCIGLSAALYAVGPWLLRIWTHGRIQIDPTLSAALLVYAAISGAWNIPRVLLMASNQHTNLAKSFLAVSAGMLLLANVLGHSMGLTGVGVAMLVAESVMAGICFYQASQLLRPDQWSRVQVS